MALLEIKNVAKHLGAIHAVSASASGAGKSTMVNLIAGNFPPTHGDVVVNGEICHFNKPLETRVKGMGYKTMMAYKDMKEGKAAAHCLRRLHIFY